MGTPDGSARRRCSADRGQVAIEYIAVLVLVAALATALLTSGLAGRAGQSIALTVCRLSGGDCGGLPDAPTGGPAPDPGEPPAPPVDQAVVDRALGDIRDALDPGFPGVEAGDLNRITDIVADLPPGELNAVVNGLSDDELRRWMQEVSGRGSFPIPWANLSDEERRRLFNELFPGLTADNVDRLLRLTDELRPPVDDIPDFDDEGVGYAPIPGAELYRDGPSPDDIQQGAVGDCHLLSSLGAIAAQDPAAIQRMIVDNGNGTYTVTFYDDDGNPVQVTVSDEFPVRDGDSPFSNPGEPPEIWPLVLEKAWAQYKGSYGEIHGAVTSETLAAMTGGETESTDTGDQSFEDLASSFGGGQAVAVSSHQPGDVDDLPEYSAPFMDASNPPQEVPELVSGHAYYVTGVDRTAGTVTIRNPWGPHLPPITLAYDDFQRLFRSVAVSDVG